MQKIRAPQGVKPLRKPLLQLFGLRHCLLFRADDVRRIRRRQQIQHHDGPGDGAAQLPCSGPGTKAASQRQTLGFRKPDAVLKHRQNALAAVKALFVIRSSLFTPIHFKFLFSFY